MAKSSKQDKDSLIYTGQLRQLHKAAARLAGEVDHPAAFAGCLAHLRTGDVIFPQEYEVSARRISEGKKPRVSPLLSPRRSPVERKRETFAEISAVAKTQKESAPGTALVAILPERELLAGEAIAIGRKMARLHLPIVLMTFGRALPQPGAPQKRLDIPEISVAAEDAVAVYRVAEESFWRARTGVGPTWIRCVTV